MNPPPAVIMNVQRQPGANIINVVDRITTLLPQLKSSLPPTVEVTVLTDRTITIRASVHDVEFELLLTVVLVVLVIFLFLRRLSATIIPSVAARCDILCFSSFGTARAARRTNSLKATAPIRARRARNRKARAIEFPIELAASTSSASRGVSLRGAALAPAECAPPGESTCTPQGCDASPEAWVGAAKTTNVNFPLEG